MPPYGRLLEFKRSKLRFLKMYILCKKCHTPIVQVNLQLFRRHSLLKCLTQPKIAKNFTKTLYFGGSRSFKVINVDTNKKLVTIACYDKRMFVPICYRFHATRANSGKITTF